MTFAPAAGDGERQEDERSSTSDCLDPVDQGRDDEADDHAPAGDQHEPERVVSSAMSMSGSVKTNP